ncbi:MAG: cyclopropane-fatty-acyl-phospholipid synthase family protein [Pseudomonadota bacterium]
MDHETHRSAGDRLAEEGSALAESAHERAGKVKKAAGGVFQRAAERAQAVLTKLHPQRVVEVFDPHWHIGQLDLHWPNGAISTLGGRGEGPHAAIHIHNFRFIRRILSGGALGFARAYIEGDWDSPALEKVIEVAAFNRNEVAEIFRGRGWVRWLSRMRHARRANTKDKAKDNISFHYDLGNSFYDQWLDPTMTYSAALFAGEERSLEHAQLEKYRRLATQLGLKPGDHVLEIGCGWGGFAHVAAGEFGAKVTGVTLSEEQLAYARARMDKAGLSDLVRLELCDYRDVQQTYDHIVSIEMFEAVGEEYWPTYFGMVNRCLKDGGKAALQIITIDEAAFEGYRTASDFIQTYIFPGGMLPSPSRLTQLTQAASLAEEDRYWMGIDYADTLRAWREDFESAWTEGRIPPGFDDTFRRIWRYYLAYCEGGFRAGGIDVLQLTLHKDGRLSDVQKQ